MLTLYSFVGVDHYVVSPALFRKFLAFHQKSGIGQVVLDLHTNHSDYARVNTFAAIASEYNAQIRAVIDEPYVAHGNHTDCINSFMEEYGNEETWCLMADCDEFIKFPSPAPAFFQACDLSGCNVVAGTMVDRISPQRPFADITDDEALDALFPFAYPLTRQVRGGWDRKIVAFKGRFRCISGRHALHSLEGAETPRREKAVFDLVDRIKSSKARNFVKSLFLKCSNYGKGVALYHQRLELHHFAWDSLLKKKMEARRAEPECIYSHEIQRVLQFTERSDLSSALKPHLLEPTIIGA